MRAVVLEAVPAPPEGLVVRELPDPSPEQGQQVMDVLAAGVLKRQAACA